MARMVSHHAGLDIQEILGNSPTQMDWSHCIDGLCRQVDIQPHLIVSLHVQTVSEGRIVATPGGLHGLVLKVASVDRLMATPY